MRIAAAAMLLCFAAAFDTVEAAWSASDGNRLLQACENELLLCEGYILGIVDARYTEGTFCLGANVERAEIVGTVKRYLQTRPELGHVAASSLVGDALADAFPCR